VEYVLNLTYIFSKNIALLGRRCAVAVFVAKCGIRVFCLASQFTGFGIHHFPRMLADTKITLVRVTVQLNNLKERGQ
jgi:hypothetical protein